jgi:ATP/ADP translocase
MPDGLLYKFLRRFGDIRQDEARPALYLFLYFFLIALSIYLVKPVKENFLIGIKSAWWPYADFITAGLIGFVVALNTRLLRKMPRKSYFSAVAVFLPSTSSSSGSFSRLECGTAPSAFLVPPRS